MKTITQKKAFLQVKTLLCLALFALFLLPFSACKNKVDYFDYVSELRSNIFLAQTEEFRLRIYSVTKENPYLPDGIKKELSVRTEIYFLPRSGDKNCDISFVANGKTLGGEMSYDNVKQEYYFSCGLDSSSLSNIPCEIVYGEEKIELNALSVRSSSVMSPTLILKNLLSQENDLFSSLTDKYGFAGEIYVRLLYEDSPYYYVGVIDRTGKTHAFLLNATNGKVLAKKQA